MYKILIDENEFDKFVNFLPDLEENEVYYLSLFARRKYCSSIKDTQLTRFTSKKQHLKEKIRRLECAFGGYRQDGKDVPQEGLGLYVGLNPRDLCKANRELLVEIARRIGEGFNPISEARSVVHRSVGRKVFVDFDYDGVEYEEHSGRISEILPQGSYGVVRTRGGFHLIVYLGKVNGKFGNWFVKLKELSGCDVKGSNTLCPVVGCYQGGFVPKLELY